MASPLGASSRFSRGGGPYSPECVEGEFSEVRLSRVLFIAAPLRGEDSSEAPPAAATNSKGPRGLRHASRLAFMPSCVQVINQQGDENERYPDIVEQDCHTRVVGVVVVGDDDLLYMAHGVA